MRTLFSNDVYGKQLWTDSNFLFYKFLKIYFKAFFHNIRNMRFLSLLDLGFTGKVLTNYQS